jgi:glycogen synthase
VVRDLRAAAYGRSSTFSPTTPKEYLEMRALAIGFAVAAALFLVTGGHLILIPLLFVPLGLFTLARVRHSLTGLRRRVG